MDDIRKMIDKLRTFKTGLDSEIKGGVDSIFNEYPELENIGTKEEYSQYLETIFPNSKIKDIVYHASPNKFTKFKDPFRFGSESYLVFRKTFK